MSTFKKINLGLFLAIFGVFSIAMTSNDTDPKQETTNIQIVEEINLSGTVLDAKTQKPLPQVEVKITEIEKTVKTNKDGEFTANGLEENKTYTIKINHDGYQKYEKQIKASNMGSSDMEVKVQLKPKSE